MSDVFISYTREDLPRVKPLVRAVEKRGWSVWWDRTLRPGGNYQKVIPSALRNARCVIVLWSRTSIESGWVLDEADVAKHRQVLVPALLDDVEIPFGFGRIHTGSLIAWNGDLASPEFDELAEGVAAILSKTTVTATTVGVGDSGATAASRSAVSISRLIPGEVWVNPKDESEYAWIPPGRFMMGCSPGDDECDEDEKPAHEVQITKGFWMGRTPVTFGAWKRYRAQTGKPALPDADEYGRKLNEALGDDRMPVVFVTWEEARDYSGWARLGPGLRRRGTVS